MILSIPVLTFAVERGARGVFGDVLVSAATSAVAVHNLPGVRCYAELFYTLVRALMRGGAGQGVCVGGVVGGGGYHGMKRNACFTRSPSFSNTSSASMIE